MRWVWVLALGTGLAWGGPAERPVAGTDPVKTVETDAPTPADLEAGRKAAASDSTLPEVLKPKVLELYDQANKWLHEGVTTKKALAALEAQVKQAPQRIAEIKERLAAPPAGAPANPAAGKTLAQVELALSEAELVLAQRREAHKQQQEELDRLLVGSKGFSEEIGARTTALEEIDKDLRTPVPDEAKAMTQARLAALKARKGLRQAELDQFKLKLGSLALLTQLAQAERDLLARELTEAQPRLEALQQAAQRLRERQVREARAEAADLQAKTADLPPEIQGIGAETARLHTELERAVGREKEIKTRLEAITQDLERTKSDFERTRQRVEAMGSSAAIGKLLSRRRADLVSVQAYRRAMVAHATEANQVAERMLDLDDGQRQQPARQEFLDAWRKGLPSDLPEGERDRLAKEAGALLQANQDARNELQKLYGRFSGELASLEVAGRQLVEVSRGFRDYIDDQLLWTPAASIALILDPDSLRKALVWYLDPALWGRVREDLLALGKDRALPLLGLGLAVLVLWRQRARARQRLAEIAKLTHKIRTDNFNHTLQALGWTLVYISPWPLLMIGAGLLLAGLSTAHAVTLVLAMGLIQAGAVLASLALLRVSCQPDGLGDDHLRWPAPIRQSLARELGWLIPLAVPLGFLMAVTAAAASSGNLPEGAQLLSQLSFAADMLVFSLFAFRLLAGRGPLLTTLRAGRQGPLVQLHFLWFPTLVLVPLALAFVSLLGYHYGAFRLEQRLELTFWLFAVLFLLKELVLRYLYIAERRLRYEEALRRREETQRRREREGHPEDDEAPPISLDIPVLALDELGEQAQRLVRAGFLFAAVVGVWSIWSRLLPVLGFLRAIDLPFNAQRVVEGVAKQVPVTLEDLVIGLLILFITALAARNLPGVLEITLLQRLPLDPGGRYAVKTLSQYSIAGIGLFAAFSAIGWQWSNIQWLVAALGVGLGFGLQEIVANFISGIILLFERPIRVGDVVTIAGTTGTVSRIRIRATTITNNDKQEFVVPNKLFITGQLVNWTLSDPMNRVAVSLSLTHGADARQALELMREAALEHDQVLKDPKPAANFEGFGDNSVILVLRCFLDSMDNRSSILSTLHQAVYDKLIAAGIPVSRAQQEFQVGLSSPVEIRLLGQAPGP